MRSHCGPRQLTVPRFMAHEPPRKRPIMAKVREGHVTNEDWWRSRWIVGGRHGFDLWPVNALSQMLIGRLVTMATSRDQWSPSTSPCLWTPKVKRALLFLAVWSLYWLGKTVSWYFHSILEFRNLERSVDLPSVFMGQKCKHTLHSEI